MQSEITPLESLQSVANASSQKPHGDSRVGPHDIPALLTRRLRDISKSPNTAFVSRDQRRHIYAQSRPPACIWLRSFFIESDPDGGAAFDGRRRRLAWPIPPPPVTTATLLDKRALTLYTFAQPLNAKALTPRF